MNEFEKIKSDPVSRRSFLQRMGAAGLGIAAISLLEGCGGGSGSGGLGSGGTSGSFPLASVPGRNDIEKTLNFALILETLEADLYRQALNLATGRQRTAPLGANASGYTRTVSGGGLSEVDAREGFQYLAQFAFVEAAHRDFLRVAISSLGARPIGPTTGGYTFGSTVNPDMKSILTALYPLEETGVRAYLGAAGFLASNLSLTTTAVSIYSTEARHSAAIAYIIKPDRDPGPDPTDVPGSQRVQLNGSAIAYPSPNTFEYFLTPNQVNTAISPLMVGNFT